MIPLLSVQHLSVSFESDKKRVAALRDISFTIHAGELLAIVGESGSGKSVTAMSILQLLSETSASYDAGEIWFSRNGETPQNLLSQSADQLRRIRGNDVAMIFQEPMTSLNPVMKCGRQVMETILLHQKVNKDIAYRKTLSLFEEVQLPDPARMFNRYPHEISGGQKQRVMIAMAMSCEPRLLIADEPTTALDVTVQKSILELITGLQKENNMAVIFITHDLGLVNEIADTIAVMYKGEIVEKGFAADILLRPQHPYTKALLACRPGVHSENKRLPVVSDFLKGTPTLFIESESQLNIEEKSLMRREGRQSTTPVISVKNLKVYFDETGWFNKRKQPVKAVDEVSFDIMEGETVGLVGESGSGKTTLGRTLLGLIAPTEGNIFFKGKDITHLNRGEWRDLRKNIQIVFQDPYASLNPRLTVGNAIAEPLEVHGSFSSARQRKEKVMELLQKVNLPEDHYNRYPHEFSGGQRQRIGIARALALNPYFIVFDESVSALDVSVQAQILNLLNDLKKEFSFTAVFISHDLSVVHYISDRILVMNQGRIVESGAANEIFFHPREEYTRKLVSSVPGKPFAI